MMQYQGSCHCGAVRFTCEAPEVLEVEHCNCSICSKSGFLHLILPLTQFRLLSGAGQLTTYTFNTGVAKHTFCRTCGVKPFYTPRSNPDGIDINVNCLDTRPGALHIVEFDGRHWEQHAHTLAHKSRSTAFHALELQSALHDGYRRVFTVAGQELLLLQHEGQLHLLENTCPHAAYPLHEGQLVDGALRCPMHGYLFDLHSGACTQYTEGPCRGLYRYALDVQQGRVGVSLPLTPLQTGPFQTGKGT